jgi:hypothetical protein
MSTNLKASEGKLTVPKTSIKFYDFGIVGVVNNEGRIIRSSHICN